MASFTQEQLIDAVREVLKERGPGYHYEPIDLPFGSDTLEDVCLYSADRGKTGSCLYGVALIEKLHAPYRSKWETESIEAVLNDLLEDGVLEGIDSDVVKVLVNTQGAQDSGYEYAKVEAVLNNGLNEIKN